MFHGGVPLLLVVLLSVSSVGALSVPDVLCVTEDDCRFGGWTSPLPDCVDGRCRCPANTCTVYTTGSRNYLFFCGSCGTLGSECNNSMECDGRWECESNFCVCDRGEVIREMCVFFSPVPTSVSNLVLILILAVLLILHKLISSKRTLCKCCCKKSDDDTEDEGTRVVAYNPSSGEKTAAYTITHSEFMVTSDDPDLEWALELSRETWGRGEVWLPMAESTWSSRASSALPEDLRRISTRGGGLPPEHPTRTASTSTGSSPSSEPGTSGWRPRSSSSSSSFSPTASVASEDQRRRHRLSTRSSTSSALATFTPLPPPPPSPSFSSSFSCPRSSSLSSSSSSTTCSHSTSPSSPSSSSSSSCCCCQRSWSVSHAPHSSAASLPSSASCCGTAGREEHVTDIRL